MKLWIFVFRLSRSVLRTAIWLMALASLAGPVFAQTIAQSAIQQIQGLLAEKLARTPAQQKLDSQLHYAGKMARGQAIATGIATLPSVLDTVKVDALAMVAVDIKADVNPGLLAAVQAQGGQVISSFPQFGAVRARLPLLNVEAVAGRADVRFIGPAEEFVVNPVKAPALSALASRGTRQERAARVRAQLAKALPGLAASRGLLSHRLGFGLMRPVDTSGDKAHKADVERSTLGFDGTGVKVGVLSDGVTPATLATLQAAGDLPAVTILAGQGGSGNEGTAMLEIVYDLAPGAQLFFATALPSQAQFAANILALRAAGCDIIVDDVTYFAEGVFQDGTVAQAVNTVTAAGALFFSSAANSGNLTSGTSGTWEGDFVDSGTTIPPINPFEGGAFPIHSFGGGNNSDLITASAGPVSIKWSDPLGGSSNDYDLFILNSTLTAVIAVSNSVQNGTQDPFEIVGPQLSGRRVVIVKFSGAARALHLDTNRGRLSIGTSGNTFGHNGAANTITLGAVSVATAGGGAFVGGATNPVETYSSDGPRRIFYNPSGTPITPGNVLFGTNGGTLLQKVDMAAADCGQSAVPTFNPFCGTSAAAPHAAAIAALVKSARPSLTAAQVRAALDASALDIMAPGIDRDSGVGIVMALGAVQAAFPDLTIVKTHVEDFRQGQTGATYTLTVTNSGLQPTTGTVTVTDTLPTGLTATAIGGSGWVCVLGSLTCTRSDALAPSASYPSITVTVNVAGNAPTAVTNTAAVSGGGELNTANDTANDRTIIALGCGVHTTHGHKSTGPPSHTGTVAHEHHGQHGHVVAFNCPPHSPGHTSGLMPEAEQGLISSALPPATEPEILAALDAETATSGAARRGTVVQLLAFPAGLSLGQNGTRPQVRIGDLAAKVLFTGPAPRYKGLWRINVLIPPETPTGQPLHVTVSYQGQEWNSIDIVVE